MIHFVKSVSVDGGKSVIFKSQERKFRSGRFTNSARLEVAGGVIILMRKYLL